MTYRKSAVRSLGRVAILTLVLFVLLVGGISVRERLDWWGAISEPDQPEKLRTMGQVSPPEFFISVAARSSSPGTLDFEARSFEMGGLDRAVRVWWAVEVWDRQGDVVWHHEYSPFTTRPGVRINTELSDRATGLPSGAYRVFVYWGSARPQMLPGYVSKEVEVK
jgi:hypothetical protein